MARTREQNAVQQAAAEQKQKPGPNPGIWGRILPAGGVGICGRSGSGKSSAFFGSDYVQCIFLADTGSQGHKIYHKGRRDASGDPVDVVMVDYKKQNVSPMDQVRAQVQQWSDEGRLWALDSFTTIIEHQCVWQKGTRKSLHQDDYQMIVGKARDLALTLAQLPGFTLFNTSPGGKQKLADGTILEIPQGAIIALPALNGTGPGRETILARWTTNYVLFTGYAGDASRPAIPRGWILPNADIRPEHGRLYCPVKDPMALLAETMEDDPNGAQGQLIGCKVDRIGPPAGLPSHERPAVDVLLERIAEKFPNRLTSGPVVQETQPTGFGIQNGKDLHANMLKRDAELAKGKFHEPGQLVAALSAHGLQAWNNGELVSWNDPEKIAAAVQVANLYEKHVREQKKSGAAA